MARVWPSGDKEIAKTMSSNLVVSAEGVLLCPATERVKENNATARAATNNR